MFFVIAYDCLNGDWSREVCGSSKQLAGLYDVMDDNSYCRKRETPYQKQISFLAVFSLFAYDCVNGENAVKVRRHKA